MIVNTKEFDFNSGTRSIDIALTIKGFDFCGIDNNSTAIAIVNYMIRRNVTSQQQIQSINSNITDFSLERQLIHAYLAQLRTSELKPEESHTNLCPISKVRLQPRLLQSFLTYISSNASVNKTAIKYLALKHLLMARNTRSCKYTR